MNKKGMHTHFLKHYLNWDLHTFWNTIITKIIKLGIYTLFETLSIYTLFETLSKYFNHSITVGQLSDAI